MDSIEQKNVEESTDDAVIRSVKILSGTDLETNTKKQNINEGNNINGLNGAVSAVDGIVERNNDHTNNKKQHANNEETEPTLATDHGGKMVIETESMVNTVPDQDLAETGNNVIRNETSSEDGDAIITLTDYVKVKDDTLKKSASVLGASEDENCSCSKESEVTNDNVNESPSEDDDIITLTDYVKMEDNMLEEAALVLGASDDKNCTYSEGYVKRQALYSCRTCYQKSNQLAGVCLACSIACHDGHSLIELYTKRNFRCDCGNDKFPENQCKLNPLKSSVNDLNSYNNNYNGLYCSCSKPYPDPNNEDPSDMVQCIVCENWYHLTHLVVNGSCPEEFAEVICQCCSRDLDFLSAYSDYMVKSDQEDERIENGVAASDLKLDQDESNETQSENNDDGAASEFKLHQDKSEQEGLENGVASKAAMIDHVNETGGMLKEARCVLKKNGWKPSVIKTAIFWNEDWRTKLCDCEKCEVMYAEKGVSFLTNLQDTIKEYERNGKLYCERKNQMADDAVTQYFSSIPHVTKIEVLENYNQFKKNITNYFKKFADNNKVVNEENIREFFEGLTKNKRRKQTSVPQYYCR